MQKLWDSGCSADAYQITSPLEDGAGRTVVMQNAIEDAGVDKNEITYHRI